jgi:nucleotide-binding universal stress UspA family protein
MERVLVPLDGSALAETILARLRPLLRRKDLEVVLARAVHVEPSLARRDTGPLLAQERAEAERYVHEVELRLTSQGIRARGLVREGPPEDALLEIARAEKADLIALGTHGRSGIARWVMGSVTEKILRASPVPVLVVRAFGPAGELPFRKILVPTDGSDASMAALPVALAFARLFGAEIVTLRVEAGVAVSAGAFSGTIGSPLEESAAREGVRATALTLTGDPASQIVDVCGPHGIDLVAMATHGRSGVGRWVLGSVTERVVRAAPVPVLVVRTT